MTMPEFAELTPFADKANAPADTCDAANPPAYTATHRTTNGATIAVAAWRGTQRISRHVGPLDATDYGRTLLTFTDPAGNVAVLDCDNPDDTNAVLKVFGRGDRVAETRDPRNDRYDD